MTANKVIDIVDGLRPNKYTDEMKMAWISDLDSMVRHLVFQEEDTEPYNFAEDNDKELLIPYPFDNLYQLYIEAMIDYYNREFSNYNNSAQMFEGRFSEYKKEYIRKHAVKQ